MRSPDLTADPEHAARPEDAAMKRCFTLLYRTKYGGLLVSKRRRRRGAGDVSEFGEISSGKIGIEARFEVSRGRSRCVVMFPPPARLPHPNTGFHLFHFKLRLSLKSASVLNY